MKRLSFLADMVFWCEDTVQLKKCHCSDLAYEDFHEACGLWSFNPERAPQAI